MKLLTGIMERPALQSLADKFGERLKEISIIRQASVNKDTKPKKHESYMKLLDQRLLLSRKGAEHSFQRRSRITRRDTEPLSYIEPNKICRDIVLKYDEIIRKFSFKIRHLTHPVYVERVRREPARYLRGVEAAKKFELPKSKRNFGKTKPEFDSPFYLNPAALFAAKHRKLITTVSVLLIVAFVLTSAVSSLINLYTSKTVFIDDEQVAGNITITDRITTTKEMSQKVAYYLLVGVDDSQKLTDCIWIMCYDIAGNSLNVMQVPRDTYVGKESVTGKFNAIYGNPQKVKYCETCELTPEETDIEDGVHTVCGSELTSIRESNISATIRAVNEHFGLPIDHFVIFNFRGFARIVDAMGGVDVDLPRGIHDSTITLSAGEHHLEGWDAVNYMRHRKSYLEGDIARVSAQRILVEALMQKALDMDLTTMLSVLTKCVGLFQTDMSVQELTALATQARSLNVSNLEMFTMPGHDVWNKPQPSYYICDEFETAEMINEKLLPYGLPDGSFASDETVNFPSLSGKSTTARTKSTAAENETGETTASQESAAAVTASSNAESKTVGSVSTTVNASSKKTTTASSPITMTTTTAKSTSANKTTTTTAMPAAPTAAGDYIDAPMLENMPEDHGLPFCLSEAQRTLPRN